jgi:hypothetical protein
VSWKATAWAKETRGHKGLASKVLLLVLSDYHDTERGYAWPSQQRLADDCEMSIRSVKYALDWLEECGFITTLQRGNQYQPTHYQLNTDIFAPTQDYEGAKSGSATIARTSVGANDNKVKVQPDASESATGVPISSTNLQEPPLEPPLSIQRVWPDWYSTLWAIPGFKISLEHATEWLSSKNISTDHAETTAYALKGKWPGPKSSPYRDPWATFQNWAKQPPRSSNGTSQQSHRRGTGKLPGIGEFQKLAAEQETADTGN